MKTLNIAAYLADKKAHYLGMIDKIMPALSKGLSSIRHLDSFLPQERLG